ncbi:hypothetical protein RND71_037087 [Anisodus tanguticus]|uniref:Uncharacterized protein n=1 Tax=Anisodus tanguticus TaxID=243964 RepID=A0AAE1R2N9_9SOLA|nr:hypothetical protein RND71_037087 [Anisodus tanguticus]
MNPNDNHIKTALYESLGLMSEDSLMNEDNEFNTNSIGGYNGGKDTHIDGQAEETSACSEESEEVYSNEQILAGPMRENQLIKNTLRGLDARQELMSLGSEIVHGWSLSKMMMEYHKMEEEGEGEKEEEEEEEEKAEQRDRATPQEQEMRYCFAYSI